MRSLSEENFLVWARSNGLLLHPSYPKSAILSFPIESSESRFWCVPASPERRPYFLSSLLDLMGDWNSCFVWRHMGSWHSTDQINLQRINDVVENQIHKGLGLPLGTADILEFTRQDLPALLTLLFATTVFGWSVGEDLYVVPDHTRFFLRYPTMKLFMLNLDNLRISPMGSPLCLDVGSIYQRIFPIILLSGQTGWND